MRELFASSRLFQIWFYSVSHSILLLRSVKSEDASSRIDIAFKNTKSINLTTIFNGLIIEVNDNLNELDMMKSDSSLVREYRVKSDTIEGYVLAGDVSWLEDHGEFFDTSELLKDMGKFQLPI